MAKNFVSNRPDLIEKLTRGVASLGESKSWEQYLDFQGKFYDYSYKNTLLILAQADHATQVAGFRTWEKLGRSVKKGEKAIWILAPMLYRDKTDSSVENQDKVLRGFKFVPVFDVSQTCGDPLPSICNPLYGDDPHDHFGRLVEVAAAIGFSVQDHDFQGTSNGDCTFELARIRVEISNSPAQRVKTLVHELSHAMLHKDEIARSLAELEAESVAYVVCQVLGIDSSDYTFGYVATWAGGGSGAIESIRSSCHRIQTTASSILEMMGSQGRIGEFSNKAA